MFPFQQPDSSQGPPEGAVPAPAASPDQDDRRAFNRHKRGWQIFGICLFFVLGAAIAIIPWTQPPFVGRGWEISVPIGAAMWVLASIFFLYWGTTVIERKARTVTFRLGWLGLTFRGWSAPLEDFRKVTLASQKEGRLIQSGSVPVGWTTYHHYRVFLAGATRASRLFHSFGYEDARVKAREVASWLGLPFVNQVPEADPGRRSESNRRRR